MAISFEERNDEVLSKGYLPLSPYYHETMHSSMEDVTRFPERYIMEECIPACKTLWAKNIYTFMVSDHLNEGVWVEILDDNLSPENKEIYKELQNDPDVITFSYHPGFVNFGVRAIGVDGLNKLDDIASRFKVQDVPYGEAYISLKEFLIEKCDCYDLVTNPDYEYMAEPTVPAVASIDYVNKLIAYDNWLNSIHSKKEIKKFRMKSLPKSIPEMVLEYGMVLEGNRVYLSPYHFGNHINYIEAMKKEQENKIAGRRVF